MECEKKDAVRDEIEARRCRRSRKWRNRILYILEKKRK
jgi:hypothetical protein